MSEDDSRVLKPTKFGLANVSDGTAKLTNSTDRFGQQYNADSDESKWSGDSPQDTRRAHARADTDVGPRSLHHTL